MFSEFSLIPSLNISDDSGIYLKFTPVNYPFPYHTTLNSNNSNFIDDFSSFCLQNYAYKFPIKSKEKFFIIKKVKKPKKGRKEKFSGLKGKHNKFSNDNMIIKFKTHFMRSLYNFINSKFLINKRLKKTKILWIIKKIEKNQVKQFSKKNLRQWLNKTIKDILYQNLSCKIKNDSQDYNKSLIDKIYEEKKETDVINILNTKVKDMINIYLNDKNKNEIIHSGFYKGLKTYEDTIKELKENGENEEFFEKYKKIVYNIKKLGNN